MEFECNFFATLDWWTVVGGFSTVRGHSATLALRYSSEIARNAASSILANKQNGHCARDATAGCISCIWARGATLAFAQETRRVIADLGSADENRKPVAHCGGAQVFKFADRNAAVNSLVNYIVFHDGAICLFNSLEKFKGELLCVWPRTGPSFGIVWMRITQSNQLLQSWLFASTQVRLQKNLSKQTTNYNGVDAIPQPTFQICKC